MAAAIPAGALDAMATRIANAHADFVETVQAFAPGLSDVQARDVLRYYLGNRLAKVDTGVGRVNVKHGALLDSDVLHRAAIAGASYQPRTRKGRA